MRLVINRVIICWRILGSFLWKKIELHITTNEESIYTLLSNSSLASSKCWAISEAWSFWKGDKPPKADLNPRTNKLMMSNQFVTKILYENPALMWRSLLYYKPNFLFIINPRSKRELLYMILLYVLNAHFWAFKTYKRIIHNHLAISSFGWTK